LLRTGETPNGIGEWTYDEREVARAGYLFCFARQSGVAIALQVTRSLSSAWKRHRPKTNKGPVEVLSTNLAQLKEDY
jgi:hypothetical protein